MYKFPSGQLSPEKQTLINLAAYTIIGVIDLLILFFWGRVAREALQSHCVSNGSGPSWCFPPNYFRFSLLVIASSLIFYTYIAAIVTKSERHRSKFIWTNFAVLIATCILLFHIPWDY